MMKTRYLLPILCAVLFMAGCHDSNLENERDTEKSATKRQTGTNKIKQEWDVSPEQFAERFNQHMELQQKNFRLDIPPKIKIGPNQNTFQSSPTYQITIIGTAHKKRGTVINAMLVARGNDLEEIENIAQNAAGMIAAYHPEIKAIEAKKEINDMVAAYDPQKEESISKIYRNLRLTYGMQTDMGLSYFSVRPAE